ncbi:1-deoxy-D-xylulose 5-phosphate reductoisomerase [bioreactor metagenome]|uniref:1-deoxy-D-xylulose-5-phosphate reductoisomerase n=1 Tax=bioreactor metagenome TaxID=1076179 RepID=A0A644V3D8_9ZZZZ|nr:1-deoxy-D-xylulose-5-phosphate reductoisomerase [Acidaminococcaceae bacterium]NLU45302.1 1-deoxy-D-xylulose-5-phosphate reductoisomerase [Acholeplasmataceae bacterium]
MKNISILGSTGSIGTQTLDVVAANPNKLKIVALAANSNDRLMEAQIEAFNPLVAALSDEKAAQRLRSRYRGKTKILSGPEGLQAIATHEEADTVLAAMVGYAGLRPTLAAIKSGKNIALANKETMVAAGSIVMAAVKQHGVAITPVDSEHSAIFQALQGNKHREVKRLLITASGGPFRGRTVEDLANVTLEQCLCHPNWSMGQKVTVDSATLANKGLEIMEAHWLFDMDYGKIEAVVHPQSIVHSLVEYVDGSVMAQLGLADMRLPIQYALSYPDRWDNAFGQLDLVKAGTLTFESIDTNVFGAFKLAVECGRTGGIMPCVFNAANEVAVYAFLAGRIRFLDIKNLIAATLEKFTNITTPSLEEIENTDRETREKAKVILAELY